MQETYVNVCGMPTKVLTWGKEVGENFNENERKEIVFMIPGNPGVSKFYCQFLETIYKRLNCPVWIVGHAGHEASKSSKLPPLKGNETIYGLQGQILYKQAFIEKYIPNDVRVHLVGHSVGAYMILELLKIPAIHKRVIKSYLLFPTIERLAETINAKFFTNVVCPISWLLQILLSLFVLIPLQVRAFFFGIVLRCLFISSLNASTVAKLVDPSILSRARLLALDEMESIRERDDDVLRKNEKTLKLYFGEKDGWAPVNYVAEMKRAVPSIDAEVSDCGIGHGFVAWHSVPMGNLVADWIEE